MGFRRRPHFGASLTWRVVRLPQGCTGLFQGCLRPADFYFERFCLASIKAEHLDGSIESLRIASLWDYRHVARPFSFVLMSKRLSKASRHLASVGMGLFQL